jgi:hypothetical protein
VLEKSSFVFMDLAEFPRKNRPEGRFFWWSFQRIFAALLLSVWETFKPANVDAVLLRLRAVCQSVFLALAVLNVQRWMDCLNQAKPATNVYCL